MRFIYRAVLVGCGAIPGLRPGRRGAAAHLAGPASGRGPTGIEEIDRIIVAALAGDTALLREMIRYTTLRCLTLEGLGGPPPCREGESEGTLVEVLPFIGPEGSHLRREDVQDWKGLDVSELVAVYRLSDQVYADENYPSGDYRVHFASQPGIEGITVHLRDGGIVRIDYHLGTSVQEIVEGEAAEMILAPSSP